MNNNGACIRRIAVLDFLEELQHANRSEGNPEIRPAGEVELSDESLRFLPGHVAHLGHRRLQIREQTTNSKSSSVF